MDIYVHIFRFAISVSMLAVLIIVFCLVVTMPDLETPVPKFCLRIDNDLECGIKTQILEGFIKQETENNYQRIFEDYENDRFDREGVIELKHNFRNYKHNVKPAARLTGSYDYMLQHGNNEQNKDPSQLMTVTSWKKKRDLSGHGGFHRFGVDIKNGRIIVPVSGYYEVYSLLNLKEDCIDGRPVHNSSYPIMHAAYKFDITLGKEVKLIESIQPHKVSQYINGNMYTSYFSSTVELKAGDELSLKVNHLSYLRSPLMNYFGAHLI